MQIFSFLFVHVHCNITLSDLFLCRTASVQDSLEGERLESVAKTGVEFRLELDPVETQRVQEGWETLHQHEDADGQHGPESEDSPQGDAAHRSAHLQSVLQNHVPQHFSEL